MGEIFYSSKDFKISLKKNLMFLYKTKLNFKKTHIILKMFYNQEFFESINKYFLDVFDCMSYEINTKKQLLNGIKDLKILTEEQYDLIYDISYEFEKYEGILSKKIVYITNLINAYNSGYSFSYSDNSSEEIILSKSVIKEKLEKIGF